MPLAIRVSPAPAQIISGMRVMLVHKTASGRSASHIVPSITNTSSNPHPPDECLLYITGSI